MKKGNEYKTKSEYLDKNTVLPEEKLAWKRKNSEVSDWRIISKPNGNRLLTHKRILKRSLIDFVPIGTKFPRIKKCKQLRNRYQESKNS